MREHYHKVVIADMERNHAKNKPNPDKPFRFDVSLFLQNFSVYKGIQQFYTSDLRKEQKRQELRQKRHPGKYPKVERKETTQGFTAKDANLVMRIKCDETWPTCFFDFTNMTAINDHFVFKVGTPSDLSALIIDDYFTLDDSQEPEMVKT